MERDDKFLNASDNDKGSYNQNSFFLDTPVEKGCHTIIETRFITLINRNCERPFDWYKDLQLDKSYASKVRRGLIIPPRWLRIKIAQYFKTDSATIWGVGK